MANLSKNPGFEHCTFKNFKGMLFKRKINDSFQTILPTFRVLEEDRKG
jgi:hypothetical protein